MPEPLRVLVADDEAPARAKLRRLLDADPRFQLVGEAEDGLRAVARVQELRPDLLLLDIQMPGLTGFEVLEALEEPRPLVVFSTAFDRFAMEAFEAAAVDYLLKPYDGARFRRALDRALALREGQGGPVKALLQRVAAAPLERLLVEGERGLEALPLRAILRLEADGKLVRLHTERGAFELRKALKDLEARLPPHRFCRVHRSALVALEAVARLEPWDHGDGLLVLKDGSHCILSRTYRPGFLARWGVSG
ncbi:MAG TPA: LytTR family DNA-binding domain-containing protein [Holophagaceae bacterium]|nr:LytTR family DNA-binding domain-containing protein [Holophagaceae bacterium]